MKKKILACVAALCLVLAVIPAFAEGSAVVSDADNFKQALEAGGDVELGAGFEIDSKLGITITKPVTLDLKGFTVNETYGEMNNFIITIKEGGSLTINDTVGEGKIVAGHASYGYGIQLFSGATFILNGGTIQTTQESIDIYDSAANVKVEINGGKVISSDDNVLGVRGSSNVSVDIKGGELVSGGRTGMYVSSYQEGAITVNMSGGSLVQTSEGGMSGAIQAYKGAVINISGTASVSSNSSTAINVQENVQLNVSGGSISSNSRSEAISVEGQGELNITGGEITSANNSAVSAEEDASVTVSGGKLIGREGADAIKKDGDTASITVKGGSFSSDVSEYVPDDLEVDVDDDGNFVIYVKVTFSDGDEATDNDTVISVISGQKIDAAQAPAFEKAGYTLSGWQTADGTAWDMQNGIVSENITLLPVWTLDAPSVTLTADKSSAKEGESIILTAEASHELQNATFAYAWYKDGALIEGQTGNTLTVTEKGSYSVKVSASDGNITSAQTESEAIAFAFTPVTDDPDNGGDCSMILPIAVLAAMLAVLAGAAIYAKKKRI